MPDEAAGELVAAIIKSAVKDYESALITLKRHSNIPQAELTKNESDSETSRGDEIMDKLLFDRYKKNKKELMGIDRALKRLGEQLDNVPTVSGKVTKSSDDFPYIEEHVTVSMAEPKEAAKIKKRIQDKEKRKKIVEAEIQAVEKFIEALPEGRERQIFELVYLDGMSQRTVADIVGYTQGRIAQKICEVLKD